MSKKKGLFHIKVSFDDIPICNSKVRPEKFDETIDEIRRKTR